MRIKIVLALLLIPVAAAAGDFTSTGVGGGGWLHSGAILPTDSDVLEVGADVSGVYRTEDFCTGWEPWNEGLFNSDRLLTYHIEDLVGIDYDGWTGFYAATHGGIYCAEENGDWESMTPVPGYTYKKNQSDTYALGIPFSCLDWRGGNLVVAGAGRFWWTSSYSSSIACEEGVYPGLDSIYAYGDYDDQWTVWTLDLDDGDPAWEPDEDTKFGAARDISFTVRNDTTYIVVATAKGIYLKDPTGWRAVFDSTDFGDSLTCWTLHLTNRGTLYAAMRKKVPGCPHPFGAYRLFDIASSTEWTWVGDEVDLPPANMSVRDYGKLYHELINLSVVNGEGSEPDILYLGSRNSHAGLFRGFQPYHEDSLCHWAHKIYSDGSTPPYSLYYRDGNDTEQTLDPGWDEWGPAAPIFPAVVSDSFPGIVLVHLCGRLHVSSDTANSWTQCYTTETVSDFWLTKGYKELCVAGLAFMGDGRLVESTGDNGVFRSYDNTLGELEFVEPPVGTPSPGNDIPYNPETNSIEVRGNWRGTGEDAIIVVSGDLYQGGTPNKLMWIDEDDDWHNLTGDLTNGDRYKFFDFIFTNDNVCFIAYAKYDAAVGSEEADLLEFGVLKGVYDPLGEWMWSTRNNGLTAVSSPVTSNAQGLDLLYNQASGRIFMAAGGTNAKFLGETEYTWVPGGIYMLPSPSDTTWELELGGAGTKYQDFRCLAQSYDGDVVYAGSRGILWASIGTVFKCDYPDTSETTWIAMANTDSTGYPFGFEAPVGTTWEDTTANQRLTFVTCLAVNPWFENVVYAGFGCTGFAEQDGLWEYTPAGGWEKLSTGEDFDGQNVNRLAIKKRFKKAKFAVGTHGLELYYTTLTNDAEPIESEGSGEAKKPSSGLALQDIRVEMGGRTEINFTLEHGSPVKVKIYDVAGRLVHYDQADFGSGRGSLAWDGSTRSGHPCASGIYFLRLTAGEIKADRKFMLLR
jgi:hypothetical protein